MHRTLEVALGLFLCSSFSWNGPIFCQEPELYHIQIVPSKEVPSGTIKGVVIDATTGWRIPKAQVWVAARIGAVTDTAGLFEFSGVPTGAVVVNAYTPAYKELSAPAKMDQAGGLLARIPLRPEAVGFEPDCLAFAIRVLVRDVRTGRAPTGITTLVVDDGSQKSSASGDSGPKGGEWTELAAGRRPGVYSLMVTNPGYQSWEAEGVLAARPEVVRASQCATSPFGCYPNEHLVDR